MANFLLGRIPELRDWLICVDPFSNANSARANLKGLKQSIQWVQDGHVLAVFPAGEVAHLGIQQREITDPKWSETIAKIIRITGAPVLPVFFTGANGALFQLLGLLHPTLRTAMLPHELLNKRGKRIEVRVGNPIGFKALANLGSDSVVITYLRKRTYLLEQREPAAAAGRRRDAGADRVESGPAESRSDKHALSKSGAKTSGQEPVAPPDDPQVLMEDVQSLADEQILVRSGDYRVLRVRLQQAPRLIREVGRLREIAFRDAGEGTGRALDLDEFDNYYDHLILWDTALSEVIGAYRVGNTEEILSRFGKQGLYTSTLFEYSTELLDRMGPSLELGRSFVRPEHQRAATLLFLLWKGIGKYVLASPASKILFGPVSISNQYGAVSRHLMVEFLKQQHYEPDMAGMISARTPFKPRTVKRLERLPVIRDVDDLSAVVSDIESNNRSIPVLLRQYLKLGGKLLGFNVDHGFGDALDGLIMVDLTETDPRILERYLGREGAASLLSHHSASAAMARAS
jgi:putative hemolysin